MNLNVELTQKNGTARGSLRNLLWVTPLAMATASVANLVFYAGVGALFPEVTAWSGASAGQIIGANVVYLLIGTVVFAIIARFSSHPARHYVVAATIGLLLSLALPISAGFGYGAPGVPPASVATVVTLSFMHMVTYTISVPLFIRYALK